MSDATDREAALAALVKGQPTTVLAVDASAPAPVSPTGVEVYAGGDEARLLIAPAHLNYLDGAGVMFYADAAVGDTVTLTKGQADRLDKLGVTVDPSTTPAELEETVGAGLWTDEQIRAGGAADLVAYVAQNPDERARVRAIEETRTGGNGKGPRATVLKATEDTPLEDDEALEAAAARALDAATVTSGPTATEVAEATQTNDAPGAGE
jgi:hypothetical protein